MYGILQHKKFIYKHTSVRNNSDMSEGTLPLKLKTSSNSRIFLQRNVTGGAVINVEFSFNGKMYRQIDKVAKVFMTNFSQRFCWLPSVQTILKFKNTIILHYVRS